MSKVDLGRTVGLVFGRTGLIVMIVAAIGGILAAVVIWAMHVVYSINAFPSYDVPIAVPMETQPDLDTDAVVQYATIFFQPATPDATALMLQSVGVTARYAIAVLACLVIIWLAVQLLRQRSFGVGTSVALGVLALGMLAVAIVAPMLEAQAVAVAVEAAGLPTEPSTPTFGESDESWVIPPTPHWQGFDFSLVALGLVTGLCALLLGRASKLQAEAEGLI